MENALTDWEAKENVSLLYNPKNIPTLTLALPIQSGFCEWRFKQR